MNEEICLKSAFLNDKSAIAILKIMNEYQNASTRFVGGCVRDAILGRPFNDIDIATKITPDNIVKVLSDHKIKYVPTGLEHGTISAIIGKKSFEITTLRRDIATDGRRAVIAFSTDFTEDAMRRDFTINALYCDENGKVYDYLGTGINDIKAKILRFVGDARGRIKEDYLRILRFFRFYAQLEGFDLDQDGYNACGELKDGIKQLSRERIWAEVKKMLNARNPINAFIKIEQCGAFELVFGKVCKIASLQALLALQNNYPHADYLQRLMVLLNPVTDEIPEIVSRFHLSNEEKKRLSAWSRIDTIPNTKNLKALAYNYGKIAIKDKIISCFAHNKADENIIKSLDDLEIPIFPINGKDLQNLGIKSGKELGDKLKHIETIWIESDFNMSRAELLALAQ